MKRTVLAVLALGLVAAGCTGPPPVDTNPYACGRSPVDLGPAVRVEAISSDGQIIVVRTGYPEHDTSYDVIDRRAGERHTITTTSPQGDGAAIYMNDAGTLVYGLRYPELAPGETPWFVHDVATRTTSNFQPGFTGTDRVRTFSSDLSTVIVEAPTDPGTPPPAWELVDVMTGDRTALGMDADLSWRTTGFSPDLSMAVQFSMPPSSSKSVRVIDTASGEVVLDVGMVRNESRYRVSSRFIDDRTVLVNDAEPFDAPPDGIADDGAFLVDVPTGTITRIDPGVAGTSTSYATPDGNRSIFAIIGGMQTWLRIDGVNELLADDFTATPNADLSVIVTVEDARAVLRCV